MVAPKSYVVPHKTVCQRYLRGSCRRIPIIDSRGLRQITDVAAISAMVDAIVTAHPQQAADFRAGKDKLLGFFVGQVMKASQGKANPDQVNAILLERLQKG